MGNYKHPGWIGKQYESDFVSVWGKITLDQILDCRDCSNNDEALNKAKQNGFRFFLTPKPSKYLNQLYKNRSGRPRCVYAELDYNRDRAIKVKQDYGNSIIAQVHMLLRAIKWRAKSKQLDYDLDEAQILNRFIKGTCEKTGLPFEHVIERSPFKPSVDRIDSSLGYTMNNIQIVCLLYNIIKSNFVESDVAKVIAALGSPRA